MIATVFIIGVSLALLGYWFRWTVALIMSVPLEPECAQKVAAANQLSFLSIRQKLYGPIDADSLGGLCRDLQHDYEALKYLLRHAANTQPSGFTQEQRLLIVNFQVMTLWFRAVSKFRPEAAKLALLEMSGTLEFLANATGQRFALLASGPSRT
jgi:hypothetical protein